MTRPNEDHPDLWLCPRCGRVSFFCDRHIEHLAKCRARPKKPIIKCPCWLCEGQRRRYGG